MYKKVLSCLFLGVFLIYAFNPLKVKAYNDLDTEISGNLTEEEMEDAIGSSILATILGMGAEIVVPGSGATVSAIYDDINDIIGEAVDIKSDLVAFFQNLQEQVDHGQFPIPWRKTGYSLSPGPQFTRAAEYVLNRWRENQPEQPQINPDYSFLETASDFILASYNYQNSTTFIADNLPLCRKYSTGPSQPATFDKTSFTYTPYANNQYFNSSVTGFIMGNITTFYVNYDEGTEKYLVSQSGWTNPHYKDSSGHIGSNTIEFNGFSNFYFYENSIAWSTTGAGFRNSRYPLSFTTLNDALVDIWKYYRHFNLYVNNQPWILVDSQDPVQIGGNTYITGTSTPVNFEFPEGTLADLSLIKSILHQLIDLNGTGTAITIQLDDILEAFTDEYGNPAMYVVMIHRNDYDNLVTEQYPLATIPDKYHGLELPKDQIQPYFDEMAYITKEAGTDLIPSDVLIILASGGVILLIAFLINRMLE